MENELLYEVDEHDSVLNSRSRGDVHRLGLRHRAVHILVCNHKGDVFLQKRAMSKDINPGLWDTSAAGHVDFGESYEESARRELAEELGIFQPERFEHLFKLPATAPTGWEFIAVYRAVYEGTMTLQQAEIDRGEWLSPEDIDRWLATGEELTSSFCLIWQRYREMT